MSVLKKINYILKESSFSIFNSNEYTKKRLRLFFQRSLAMFLNNVDRQYKKKEILELKKVNWSQRRAQKRNYYSSPTIEEIARDEIRSMDRETDGFWRDI